jgi:SAM-dependent methyltransferase
VDKYTGTDNLEVMALATNYNRFLTDLVAGHARRTDAILDFGAGIGTFASWLIDRGYKVSCIETDPDQAQVITAAGIEVQREIGSFPDASFDYIYTLNVLEHIEYDIETLRQLKRILKPDGKIFIYVPAMAVLYSSMDEKVGHHRRYSRHSLNEVCRKAGYRVRNCLYADSLGFPATLLFKLSGNTSGDLNPSMLVLYDRWIFPLSRLCDRIVSRFFGKNVYCVLENE